MRPYRPSGHLHLLQLSTPAMSSSEVGSLLLDTMPKRNSQVITCKAAVCWGAGEALKIEEIQVEAPGPSEVRIKMLCSSVCHTDILYWKREYVQLFPIVLGHEGVGVVESVGELVTEFKQGDIVIPTYVGECKECENCRSEKTNFCHKYPIHLTGLMTDGTSRMSIRGQRLYHMFSCATWSEFTVVNANYLVKAHPSIALPHACLISCGFSTGFGAAWKEADVQKGSSVAVFGLGGVGLGVVKEAEMLGATKIIGVDLKEWRGQKGMSLGMTDFINPTEDNTKSLSERIKDATEGLGVDYSFECTGVSHLLNQALESTKVGRGVTIVIGAINELSVPINFMALMAGRTLRGSIFGGVRPRSDLPSILAKCMNKELQLDALVTHQVQLDDINHVFELQEQPDCLKIIIGFDDKKHL